MPYKKNDQADDAGHEEEEIDPAAGEVKLHQPGDQEKVQEYMNRQRNRAQDQFIVHGFINRPF